MPDKLTDNEIVTAYKHCMFADDDGNQHVCPYCPYFKYEDCTERLVQDVFNIIHRLQAENERLKKGWKADIQLTAEAKAEAYKEFAERLKELFKQYWFDYPIRIFCDETDNLLKELVCETQPNDVKCIDCEYLELSLPYGVCSKEHKMVDPDDSCGKGKLKEEGKDE